MYREPAAPEVIRVPDEKVYSRLKIPRFKKRLRFVLLIKVLLILILTAWSVLAADAFGVMDLNKIAKKVARISGNKDSNYIGSNFNSTNRTFSITSTEGKITTFIPEENFDIYTTRYDLFGMVETDGDMFYIDVLANGEEVNYLLLSENSVNKLVLHANTSGKSSILGSNVGYKNFYFELEGLQEGVNNITIKLYDDFNKVNLLDEKTFSINKLKPVPNESVVIFNTSQVVDTEALFKQININFEKEALWTHTLESSYTRIGSDMNNISNETFFGKGPDSLDHLLEKRGEINVDGKNLPLYRLKLNHRNWFAGNTFVNAFYFYVLDGEAYFITNTVSEPVGFTPIYFYYMKSSPYLLTSTILDLKEVPIDSNNRLLPKYTDSDPYACEYVDDTILFTYKGYVVYDDYSVSDKFGYCLTFALIPQYYTTKKPYDLYNMKDYKGGPVGTNYKLDVTFDNGTKPDKYYSYMGAGCGGRGGTKKLDQDKVRYLEKVGVTSTNDNVYIFSTTAPYSELKEALGNVALVDNYQYIREDQWQEFLSIQKDKYPVLVIKNVYGEWIMHINEDFYLLPGC